jgi:hypothetical protein
MEKLQHQTTNNLVYYFSRLKAASKALMLISSLNILV